MNKFNHDARPVPDAVLLPLHTPALDPLFWPLSRSGVASAWVTHVPFAHWLVATHRPRVVVELGTHNGVSFSAFCEAVQRAQVDCCCLAFDTWMGDEHSGSYGEEVYADFKSFHDSRYGGFSHLTRCTFDAGAEYVADGSVDLLHIDGLHTYEAVRHDFETWKAKLSERGIVLFHDINERERGFGVWRLWGELRSLYPSFTFLHGHGLGVLAVGPLQDEAVQALTGLSDSQASIVRERFSILGERWRTDGLNRDLVRHAGNLDKLRHAEAKRAAGLSAQAARAEWLEQALQERAQQLETATAELARLSTEAARTAALDLTLQEMTVRLEAVTAESSGLRDALGVARTETAEARTRHDALQDRLGATEQALCETKARSHHLEMLMTELLGTLEDPVKEAAPAL